MGHKRVSQFYNFPPAAAGSREAWIMPTISRLRGRFFCVLIPLVLAMVLPPATAVGVVKNAMVLPSAAGIGGGAMSNAMTSPLEAASGEGGAKNPSLAPILCQISEGLFGAKSGDDKKAAALSFVTSAVGASDAILSKNIVDANKFQEGLGKVIDGVVTCLNASVWAHK